MLVDELHAGITKKLKRQKCISTSQLPANSRPSFSNFTYLGIVYNIEFGRDWFGSYLQLFKLALLLEH